MLKDIENRSDISVLVDKFYTLAMTDELLSPFFTGDLAIDFEVHKPIMVDFWEFNLFQTPMIYLRNVMNPHLQLNDKKKIKGAHFERWISLFQKAVDLNFSGENATKAKENAYTIGATLQYKIKKINQE
jgi:hemoglobin